MQFRLPVYGKPVCIRQPICAHADDSCAASLSAQCIKRSCCTFAQQLLPFFAIEYFLSHSNCYDFKASDRNFIPAVCICSFGTNLFLQNIGEVQGFKRSVLLDTQNGGFAGAVDKTCHPVSAFCFLLEVGEHHAFAFPGQPGFLSRQGSCMNLGLCNCIRYLELIAHSFPPEGFHTHTDRCLQ